MAVIKTYNPCPLLSCKHKYNIMANTISQDLFNKVRGQFSNMTLGRADGQQTLDAKDAVFFEFDYVKKGQNLGSLVVSLVDDGALKVYFNNDIVTEQDQETTQGFYNFLESLKKFAVGRLLNYEAKNISKSRLDKKDFDFLAQQNKTEEELTMESKLYGSRQKSYQDLNGAKLIVQHTQSVDEERHGARSRNIKAIYIENSDGERYRFENNYLPGARAMARHVSNGGYTKDDHGQHISEIMAEMGQLKTFVRGVKRQDYVNEDAQDIIEKATGRYYGLKSTLESISKQKGYLNYFENFAPDEIDVTEDDLNDIKAKLTRQVFDDRLQDSLGAVGKAMKLQEKKSGDFYDWDDWSRSAKQNGAEIQGDIDHAVAVVDGKEIGEWNQDEQDRTGDKIASRFKKPGYGELNVDAVDRDDTPERDFQMPTELKLIPGEMAPLKQASDKNAILQLVLVDIAGRAVDDEVSIFAADMADKLGSVGTPFGQRMTPEFKAQKIKAVDLAKMYLKQHSGKKAESVEAEEVPRKRPEDPFESYQQSMEDIVLAKETKPDFLDLDGDGDKEEPMKKAAKDKEEDEKEDGKFSGTPAEIKKQMKAHKKKHDKIGIGEEVSEGLGAECKDCGCKVHEAKPGCGCSHDNDDEHGAHFVMIENEDDEVEEGNAFSDALRKAKEAGEDEFTVDGKTYQVEGKMSDIEMEVEEMIQDGADDTEIMAKFPGIVSQEYLDDMRAASDEKQYDDYEMESQVDEGRLGFKDLDKLGRENASKVDIEARRRGSAYMEPGDADRLRYKVAKEMGLVEATVKEDDDMAWLKRAAGIGSNTMSNHGIREGEQGYQITPRSIVARQMRKLQDIEKV